MAKRSTSLRSRIRIVIITIVISLFLLELLIALSWFRSRYTEETNNELEIASAIGLTFRSLVRDISRTEFVIGLAFDYTPFTNGEIERFFQMINDVYPVVQNFVIADSSGRIITASSPELIGVSVADRKYFQRLKNHDTTIVSGFLHLRPDNEPGFVIARGFYSPAGDMKFAVIAGVMSEKLGEITLVLKRRPGEFITLFDNGGILIYTNQNIGTLTDSLRFNWKENDKLLQKALQGKAASGFFEVPVKKDSRRIGARVPIDELNWVAGAAVIQRDFFQPLVLSFLITFISMIIVTGITILFSERTVHTINRSLRSVQDHVKNVAQGEFSSMEASSGFIEFDSLIKDANYMAQQLKDREEKLKLLAAVVENSNDFIVLASPGMVPFYINTAGSHMVGIDREGVKKTHLIDYFPEEDRELLEKETIPSLYREERWVGEVRIRNFKTGQLIPTIWNAFAIKDKNGAIIAWATISPDLTDLKKTTEELKFSEQRFRGAIDGLLDAFVILEPVSDEEGNINDFIFEYVNRVALLYAGKKPEDFLGHREKELFSEDITSRLLPVYMRVVTTGEPALLDSFPVNVRSDDHEITRYLDIRASRLEGKIAVAWRDATKRVESENSLKELNQNLETIVQKRTEQVSMLSKALILAEQRERKRFSYVLHENLQQLILGSSILLNEHLRDHQEEKQGEFDDVAESVKLLENALQTTKILSIELNPPILPSQGLDVALVWLSTHMRQNYDLLVDLKISGAVSSIKNETQLMLTQMVRELLNNVVQHAGVKNATIDASFSSATVRIAICDKGCGFDLQKEMDKKSSATRLGLFSIRERLKLFGGDLIIESTPGKGTCNTIVLPLEST